MLGEAIATAPVAWYTTATLAEKKAFLSYPGSTIAAVPNQLKSVRSGFLQSTVDSSVAAPVLTNVAHTFGRLGQGMATTIEKGTPFVWSAPLATNKPGMMISIFPETDADTGLVAAADKIEIIAKAKLWAAMGDFNVMGKPDDAKAPDADIDGGANALAAGLVATAAVLASLY